MTRQTRKDREEAVRNMTRLGIAPGDQVRLLRLGQTLHRLAEAQCNGDWPADNGERKVRECGEKRFIGYCPAQTCCRPDPCVHAHDAYSITVTEGCGSYWDPSVLRKTRGYLCPDCCATEDVQAIARRYGLRAVVNGDPRGAVLLLAPAGATREDLDSGRVRGEYVR